MNFDFLSPYLGVLSQVHINFVTWLRGSYVGHDAAGNRYYESARANPKKRWVIYAGRVDASEIPPEWHAWVHYQTDVRPDSNEAVRFRRRWQRPHLANQTGTNDAYVPAGHQSRSGHRARATGDYTAWKPAS